MQITEARRRNILDPASARAEWVNLMRWRLQTFLGYAESHAFTMKNTGGQDLYDMIFVTDNNAGDKIMRYLYGRAVTEHEDMRQYALALRRDKRLLDKQGIDAMFDITPGLIGPKADIEPSRMYKPEPPREPYRLP
jgi:hypothetical protein